MSLQVITLTKDLKSIRDTLSKKDIGLVPTMGNLHQGHISLIEMSLNENPITFVTIFVNPKQFGPNEDLKKYPRTLEDDLNSIRKINQKYKKQIFVFAPTSIKEIYPDNFSSTIKVDGITNILCGKSRPTHFDGVTTVVYKLFSLIKPLKSYFGEKDYQQLLVIKKMTTDLDLEIDIIPGKIIRDTDGLALSSRNQFLNPDQKKQALILPTTLQSIKEQVLKYKCWKESKEIVKQIIQDTINKNPDWDYLEIYNSDRLTPPEDQTVNFILLGAFKIGSTRLIDNLLFKLKI